MHSSYRITSELFRFNPWLAEKAGHGIGINAAFFRQCIAVCYCPKIDMQIGRTDVKKSA